MFRASSPSPSLPASIDQGLSTNLDDPSTRGNSAQLDTSPVTPKSTKKGNVFTRVFNSGSSTSQYRAIEHSRSGSSDFLVARKSHDDQRPRSQTPPTLKSRPPMSPPSSYSSSSKKKKARPVSLNVLPPTINTLDAETKADLLRKNRKLQQVLGNDYYAASSSTTHRSVKSEDSSSSNKSSSSKKSGKRAVATESNNENSISSSDLLLSQSIDTKTPSSRLRKKPSRPSYSSHRSRSYSASSPTSPSSFLDEPISPSSNRRLELLEQFTGVSTKRTSANPFIPEDQPTATATSFEFISTLDLEDDDAPRTGRTAERKPSISHLRSSSSPPLTPTQHNHQLPPSSHTRSFSISTISTMSSDAAAIERKKKRERLVKLHRFLGSNVPAELVVGSNPPGEEGLPPAPAKSKKRTDSMGESGSNIWSSKKWKGRRRSDSGFAFDSAVWERPGAEEPMTEQDRVLNVRRKAKMEKMFGANPPQGLYLTRSTSESSNGLDTVLDDTDIGDDISDESDNEDDQTVLRSLEFLRHRHSLISLTYLVDKDDREQLENLFNELAQDDEFSEDEGEMVFAPPEDIETDSDFDADRPSIRFRKVLERRELQRRSMPPRSSSFREPGSPSIASPSSFRFSAFSVASPTESSSENDFQARRKRAAKLTKFFGTDYRSLFGEVLDSIESGVREDQTRGTLTTEEAQELLRKLRRLKAKQNQISFN